LHDLFDASQISDEEISNMSDNIILLSFTRGAEMNRTIRIIKTRGSAHDRHEQELEVTSTGVAVKKLS
jgi:KaiC protein